MKRSPALQPLSRDHHQALVFAKRMQTIYTRDPNAAGRYWHSWRDVAAEDMVRHFDEEERRFLALLREKEAPHLERQLLEDHQQLRQLLMDDDVSAATRFAELLKAHVRFEERELFGWIEAHS